MRKSSRTNYKRLSKLKDNDIDFSDIPETDEAFWRDAEIVLPQKKIHLSIRLDQDIVNWFKKFGRGYQTRINAVLRFYIKSVAKKKA